MSGSKTRPLTVVKIVEKGNKYNYVGLNPAALINYLSNFSNIFKHQIQTIWILNADGIEKLTQSQSGCGFYSLGDQ